jgi:ATP-binding cassette, subfamily B, bacterial PglK
MVLSVVSAFAEVVSLGAALPFIAVLAAPELAFKYQIVADAAARAGITEGRQLVLPLTVVFGVAAVAAAAIRLFLTWASVRFTFSTGAELSQEVYRRTLYQPYDVHIRRSSSEVISGIAAKVGGTMFAVLLPSLVLASSAMVLVAIMFALLAIDPLAALISAVGFGSCYAAITRLTNRTLRKNSHLIAAEQTQVVKALQEGLGGIRDVLLDGTQPFYCETYRRAEVALRRAQATNVFIPQSARPLVEAFGMVLIALLAYGLSMRSGGISSALPVLVALALGAQRLLPALQQVYVSWASIAGSEGVLNDTLGLLEQPLPAEIEQPPPPPLSFSHAIELEGVRFRYAPEAPWVIDGIDVRIPVGARVGFVGSTGSGKSTTIDLLMGLLVPLEGEVRVDGQVIRGSLVRAWQRAIAHVPQNIYLADATLAENIAFGVPRAQIDMERVKSAARQAQLADFAESRPQGYEAMVGERGVRLSGGQRQRIGIARALYKQANVLVLDEATSALDNVTEKSVMDAIEALDRELTILLIAHRLSTVRRCDIIVQLEDGRVVAQGSYEQLIDLSQSFRQMARAATF